jgi:hypothetical protein
MKVSKFKAQMKDAGLSKRKPPTSKRAHADKLMAQAKKGIPNVSRRVRPLTDLISGVEDFGLNRNL